MAQVDLDADALGLALGNALVNAMPVGQGKKVPSLETVDPDDWTEWRRRFQMIASIAAWNDLRKRRELYAAMKGPAAKAVSDIAVEDPPGDLPAGAVALDYAAVIAAYEARFLTAAASDQARADFQVAVQHPEETLLCWHGRCRELFIRAFPGADTQVGATGQMLRDRFTMGLEVRSIKEFLWDRRPDTYELCLTTAQTKEATLRLMEEGGRKKAAVHAVGHSSGRSSSWSSKCFFCSEEGHQQRSCPQLDKARELLAGRGAGDRPSNPAGFGRGTFRGRRGRGFKRTNAGRGRGGGMRSRTIAAMDRPEAEAEETTTKSSSSSHAPSSSSSSSSFSSSFHRASEN